MTRTDKNTPTLRREPYLVGGYTDTDVYWRGKPEASGLVVMPLDDARRLAAFRRAIRESYTWHDLIEKIDDDKTFERVMDELEGEVPHDSIVLDLQDVADDFIPRPQQLMLTWLPESVQKLGNVIDPETDSAWLHLPEDVVDDVRAALLAEGYDVYRDLGYVIKLACGEYDSSWPAAPWPKPHRIPQRSDENPDDEREDREPRCPGCGRINLVDSLPSICYGCGQILHDYYPQAL